MQAWINQCKVHFSNARVCNPQEAIPDSIARGRTVLAALAFGTSMNAAPSIGLAASAGRLDMVKRLVEGGADINEREEDGSTALYNAVLMERLEVTRYLFQKFGEVITV